MRKILRLVWFLVVVVAASEAMRKPGHCKSDMQCHAQTRGYTCVSLQTSRTGAIDVKQCLPNQKQGDVCAGVTPGLCPSMSTWPIAYKSISAVCAFIYPSAKCKKPGTPSKAGFVNCMYVKDNDGEEVGVIYGCVDYSVREGRLLFKERSTADKLARMLEYDKIVSEECINPSASDVVCSGRGTCIPTAQLSMTYRCECTVGYIGRYCQKIDSNKCINAGQCAAGTCNLKKQQCECVEGTTGNQCAFCDPSSSKACSGHGTCVVNTTNLNTTSGSGSTMRTESSVGEENKGGVCECEEGRTGDHCDRKIQLEADDSGNSEGSLLSDDISAASVASISVPLVLIGSLTAMLVLMVR